MAESILFEYARILQIGSLDALHLAMVKRLQVPLSTPVVMVTSDQSMQKVCDKLGIPVYDQETD